MNRMKHPFASRTVVLRLLCICFFSFLGLAEMQAQVRAFAGVTKLVGCGSGANAGKAEVSVTNATGGSGNYEYSFDNTTTWVTTNKSWLSPSAHTIWVRDRNNHSLTHAMPITVPAAPSVVPVITKEVLYDCNGKPTLKVGVQNPQPSYRYYFKLDNAAAFSSNYIFPNISSGTHTITVKYEDTTVPSPSMLLREDFGVGPENMTLAQVSPGASTTYQKAFDTPDACGYVPNVNNIIDRYYVTNGQKVIEAMCWGNYATPPFYTTPLHGTPPAGGVPRDPSNSDPQARYFMIDLNATGEVFRKKIKDIDGTKNVQIRVKFYNLIPKNTGAILPTLRLKLFNGGTEVFTTPQFVVPEGRTWDTYSFTAPANGYTNLDFVIYSDISGAGGNDLAMDDIEVFQLPDICGIETSDTATITELGVPSIYANVSNCSASNNTVNLVVTPTTSDFSYQYQMDGGTLQTSPTFTGLAMNSTHTFKVHYKPVASVVTLVNEDFGVGANAVANSYVNREYFFESMNGANIIYNGNGVPKDNTAHIDQTVDREYAISTHIHATLVNIWHTPTDASGTPNGRKLLIDLDITKPAFYMRPISVLPHKRVDFSAAIFNLLKTTAPSPCNIPGTQVRVRFYPSQAAFEANQTPIKSQTLALPLSATPNDWKRLAVSLSDTEVGANTSLFFVLDLSGTGGCNDIAVDDIVITQALAECSKDFTTTIKTSVTNAFAGVTKLIGCGASANANKAEVTIANVEGGSGNYEYSFDGITWTASNTGWLSAGTHTVSVRDAATHGCPFDMSVTVPAALAQPTIKTEVFYGCDGRPILKVGVENPDPALNYLYKLDGGAFTTTYIFNNIATGTHQVSVQYEYASAPSPVMLLKETFGSQANDGCLADPSMTTYLCEAGKSTVPIQGGYGIINGHSGLLNRGIAPCTIMSAPFGGDVWVPVKDHTTMGADPNGRFFMVDAKPTSAAGDLFYKKTVKNIPLNSNINIEFFILNLFREDAKAHPSPIYGNAVEPNIRVLLKDKLGNEITHFDTGAVPNSTCGAGLDNWKKMQGTLNSGNNSEFTIEFRANQSVTHGWGNDFCIDDITVFVEPKACGQVVSATTNVTTNPVGVPTFNASISNCSNTNSTITWVASPTTGYTYTYTIQGGTATSSNVFNGLATGTYTFTVNYAPVSNTIVLLNEDFGAGTDAVKNQYVGKEWYFNNNTAAGYTAYNGYGQTQAHSAGAMLWTGEYTIAKSLLIKNIDWRDPVDHSGKPNGRVLFVDGAFAATKQDVYTRKVSVVPNTPLTFNASFISLVDVTKVNPVDNQPPYHSQVQLQLYENEAAYLANQTPAFQNNIYYVSPSTSANDWRTQTLTLTGAQVGNRTQFYAVIRMHNVSWRGHDLAVDDIIVKQTIACQATVTATVANQVQKAFAGVTKLIGCGTAAEAGKAEVTIANVEGGSGTYEYSFDNGLSWGTTNAGWVPAGTHTVSVRDGISKSCAYDMSVTVPAALAQPTIKTEVFYACDGKAILNVGVENPNPELKYLYSLDGSTPSTTYVFTNVSSGTHQVSVQYKHRSTSSPYILMKEDFGKGGPMALSGIVPATWAHQPATTGVLANDCLHEGKYTVAPQNKVLTCSGWCWTIPKDHTSNGTDATGRFYAMNVGGALAGQRFYYKDVDNVQPNRPLKYEMYLMNLLNTTCQPHPISIDANIEIRIIDKATSAVLDTKTTGRLPRATHDLDWRKYEGTLNPGSATSIRIEFRDLETGNSGNDFAIDDIIVYQEPVACGQVVSATQVVTANGQDIPSFTVSKTYDCATGKGGFTVTPTATTGFTYTYTLASTTYTSTTATFTGLNLEQTYTVTVNYQAVSNTITLLNEDFGAGTDAVKSPYTGGNLYYDKNINANYTAYNANGQSKAHSGSDLNEGEYTISHNLLLDIFSGVWRTPNDHTGNTNGRIFFVNPSPSALQTIYAREVNVLPNQALTFSAYFYNLLKNTGSNNPKVRLTVYKNKTDYENNSTPLKSFTSNEILHNANNPNAWKQESVSLTATEVGARLSVYVVVSMVNPVSGGHDMAMDDIKVTQVIAPCTTSVTTTLTKGDVAKPTLTLPSNLNVVCSASTASATIQSWLASATATSTCGTATVTHNYSYPSNLCNAGGAVTVTFSTTDPFGNVVTATRVISFATMTLTVTPTTLSVPNGALGGTTSSVVPNITLGGVASPSTNSVTISFSGLPAGVTTDTQGRLVVAPNTPATNTTISYTVCETGSQSNCTTVSTTLRIGTGSLTVTPTPMTLPNGNAGGTTTPSVLTGVVLNGQPVTDTTSVTLTWNSLPPGATGNNNGTVTVAPNTPAGTYTVSYTVCERLNSASNCETITSTLTIGTGSLTVTPVTPLSVPNGALGGTTTQSILTGVTLNGTPNPSVNSVTISFSGLPAGVTTDTQGRLVIAPNTPATDTTISYRVCEKVNPSNCQTANTRLVIGTGSLTVTPTPMTLPNGNAGGTTTPSVLTGVVLNGQPVTDTTSVTLTWNTVPPRATGNPDGTVTVAPNTPAGTYTVSYTICERLNSASNNCKTVTSTLTIAPNALTVQSDTFTVTPNGTGTQTTPSVLDNDRIGTQTPTAGAGGTVTITNIVPATPSTAGAKVPSLNPDTGRVEVPANTPAGTYTISYQVCETLNPTNCGPRQTVTVTVTNGTLTVTSTELRVANGSTGGSSVNSVLGGVTLNGQTPPSTSSVTISWNSLPPSFTGNTNGTVSVPAGTASGTYTMTYTVCETLNGTGNCKTVSGTIKVGSGEIVVTPVPLNVANGTTGGTTTPSVLTGVTLNGQTPPNTNSVTLTWNQLPPNSVGNTDGTITVHPNTPAGTYTVSYTVCERLNSGSNCETVTNTITIGGGAFTVTPVTQITVPNGANGGTTTPSVLDGITLNGQTPTTGPTGNVTLTWNQLPPNATGNPDGTVTIAPNTPAGTYTTSYTICERLNGNNNCHTYTTTVQVGTPDLSISPKTYLIPNAAVGGTTSSVLENVTYNGQNPPTTSSVTLTFGSLPSGVTTTTNGGLQVTPGTPAGVYSVSYTVCEVLNPSHCVNGVATIAVGNVPVVRPDSFTHSGTSTSTTPSVLDNDTVGTQSATAGVGGNVTITNIQVTPQHPGQPGPTMNPNDGRITVPGDTPAGVYTITYDVCTTATPSTCTSGVATLTVPQPTPVLPNNNMVYTNTTTTTAGNILDGGKVGTQTATAGNGGNVTITITEPATPKEPGATVPTLDPNTGQITVPAGTPTGTYTITYQVCTTATPTSCTTGIATVTVSGTTGAVPPAGDVTANTLINTPVDVPVLPAGTATGSVTIGVPTPPSHGTTTINPDGTITYQPDRDFVGTDSFVYELCNASGCHSGTVTVEVSSELKIYNAISLTGSGRNDHFHIGGIENYPNNVVRIYNRWGVEVFKVEGYDNVTKVFKGISEGRSTVEPADKLPQGTYYYLIEYQDDRNNTYTKVGWLYLKK